MKLAYITNTINGAGGIQRILAVKSNYLIKHENYEVTIIVTNATEEPIYYTFHPLIKIITINPDRSALHYYNSYKKLINKTLVAIQPDVVSVCDNGLKSYLLPYITSKKYPMVYELHVPKHIQQKQNIGINIRLKQYVMHKLMGHLAKGFEKFVVLTKQGLQEWNLNSIEVIPNPLWLHTDAVSSLTNKIAIAVGRHVYEKGYDRMLEAWKIIMESQPGWILKIYGEANKEYNVLLMAKSLGISDSVQFMTAQDNIEAAYNEASIHLLTSRYEGFGLVLLEAAAYGVPSVAFDCPVGPKDIITHGKDGYLIENGDISAFAEAVINLIENNTLRQNMGNNAKEKAEIFAIEPIMEKWDRLFKSLVKA